MADGEQQPPHPHLQTSAQTSPSLDNPDRTTTSASASSSSSPTSSHRFDSAVALSPASPPTSSNERSPLLPPLITGHGPRRHVVSRQTIPAWLGVIIVAGVLVWTTWLSIFVVGLLWRNKGGREDDGFGGWSTGRYAGARRGVEGWGL
ncbi:hypothetical protein K505DRAFT_326281 [Melanomma pulvis-pyrius CBS 109.77]|uniref:Uncharacterized protein n=1 Tax=Melanomma pulvis-pyrius CBS 109.77 TaxID=1314802 RepID=A0A6A6X701_9PLEO|nr:hypothetical protein K505DRAFT_326281 [Melanomma pulvis-pyrius CBS 109.77]